MPCDWTKYPKDWKAIRARILAREGNRCKFCKRTNYSVLMDGELFAQGRSWQDARQCAAENQYDFQDSKFAVVCLTIAHLDHNTTNNADGNLAALCQKCHNRHDVKFRRANAARTRDGKRGQERLFAQ